MTDISNELQLITSQLSEKLEKLESEFQRWTDYKTDYDALQVQLETLPETTTKAAMIPLGKLAFMPGKIIHTNEILVLLGDQYYAERSAKQAIEILGRRREVVVENLRLVEAQLNSFKQKTGSIMKSSSALANLSEPQINEEGLPIMDIREELPDNYDEIKKEKEKKKIQSTPNTTSSNELPESVLRARAMMKEADEKINQQKEDKENKALFDLLRELEEEEEEEEEVEKVHEPKVTTVAPTQPKDTIKHIDNDDESDDDDMDSFSDDSEDDDRYDTEISENMFDRFGDDEQYPLDGVVDQEDFTAYEEDVVPQIIPASSIKELRDDEIEEYEKSTPKVITKRKSKVEEKPEILEPVVEVKESNPFNQEPAEPVKKMSKFKLAQQQKKAMESSIKENSVEKEEDSVVPDVASTPKKFSKFKLLRQQQKPRNTTPVSTTVTEQPTTPVSNTVTEQKPTTPVSNTVTEKPKEIINVPTPEEIQDELMQQPPKPKPTYQVKENGIPKVIANKPKKMSKFKLERQQSSKKEEPVEHDAPLQAKRVKPKRSVTWDSDISIRDHDNTAAPSAVSETYSEPMKSEPTHKKTIGSLFKQMRQSAAYEDGYPSLDDDENDKKVDLNELVQEARKSSEAFWRPNDGSEALIPMVKQDEEEEEEEEPSGIIVAKKNKLDNKIMKGAVMERDIVPVDLEQVEDDMDLREITSNYQQLRQSMLASTGGFSFATKPEFEVFDEELPIPKKPGQKEEEEEEEVVPPPKKMSRFKAARLGMRMDTNEEDQ